MKYRFRTAKSFRRALTKLNIDQKRRAAAVFKIFREDPFDPRLRSHKIHKLSAAYGKTVYAAVIDGDLRVAFYLDGNTVWSVDIGNARYLSISMSKTAELLDVQGAFTGSSFPPR